jgi:hypothetical protein
MCCDHRIVGTRHDELLRDFERVNEARTSSFKIERSSPVRAYFLLHQARRRWKGHVRSNGSDDNEINFVRCNAGLLDCLLRRFRGQIGGEFILCRNAPFSDASSTGDPFV